MSRRSRAIVILSMILALLIIASVYVINSRRSTSADRSETAYHSSEAAEDSDGFAYNGRNYKFNTDLDVLLFMGIDKKTETKVMDEAGRGGQSDSLILLAMNRKTKQIQMVTLSRDTMANVKVYGMNGDYIGTQEAQIATQFAYGDGEKRSALLTKELVAELLHNIPIRSYMALDIAGLPGITDQIGGVPITVGADYTDVDPAFIKGAQLNLTGAQAYQYVQHRDTSKSGSNNERMARQNEFIHAFFAKMTGMESSDLIHQLWQTADPYMTTNLTADEAESFSGYTLKDEIVTVPGEMKTGVHDELYLNDDTLNQILVKYFFTAEKQN